MRRLKNVEDFVKYDDTTDHMLTFKANEETGMVSGEFEVKVVGPCAAFVHLPDVGKNPGPRYLLCLIDADDTIVFSVKAPMARVVLQPSAEVWFRKRTVFQSADNPNPDQNFTRMEKPGLYQDELGIALHRQAVLNRIQQTASETASAAAARRMAKQLEDLTGQIAELRLQRAPPVSEPTQDEVTT